MHFCRKIILLICLCMSTGACVAWPTYGDPQLGTADDSEVAILRHRWEGRFCVDEIKDAAGKNIPLISSEQHPIPGRKLRFEKFRLSPGQYEIKYSCRSSKSPLAYGLSRVTLKAGHVYRVTYEACWPFCFRMDSRTSDIWLEDMTTDEWIGGCRQGMGCVENGQLKPYSRPPSRRYLSRKSDLYRDWLGED